MSHQKQPQGETTNQGRASGSGRSDRESETVVIDNDHHSLRSARSRPLARLDRLLRRWLPGYNYLRGGGVGGSTIIHSSSSSSSQTNRQQALQVVRSALNSSSTAPQRCSSSVDATLRPDTLQKRKDGEVVLDTGIAKSEFCMKLEKLLRAKLLVKE